MKLVGEHTIFVFQIFLFLQGLLEAADSSSCGDWLSYKDQKCYKLFDDTLRVFDDAQKACSTLEDSPTLPIIHTKEEQDFLVDYIFKTQKKVENVWIGARFSNNKFHWVDNSELTGYTNWDPRGQRNKTNYCLQMQSDESVLGKWIDEPCEKKGFAVCQKMQSWSTGRLQKSFMELRDLFEVSNTKFTELKHELDEANKKISESQTFLPIGFIYTQLPNEKAPHEMWPLMNWTDVSATYAGVFFRVTGTDAAEFGQIQQDNAPRLEEVYTSDNEHLKNHNTSGINSGISISRTGWSSGITGGSHSGAIFTNFKHSAGEVRPRNMAIRIWKKIA